MRENGPASTGGYVVVAQEEVGPRRVRAFKRGVGERERLSLAPAPAQRSLRADHSRGRLKRHDGSRWRRQRFGGKPVSRSDIQNEDCCSGSVSSRNRMTLPALSMLVRSIANSSGSVAP